VSRLSQFSGYDYVRGQILPIFSAATLTKTPLSSMESIENSRPSTGLSGNPLSINYATGQFIVSSNDANVATSPDGLTWTLRAMPSSGNWQVGVSGADCVAVIPGTTTTAKSSNSGLTWTSGGTLPGNANGSFALPVCVAGVWLIQGSGTSIYRSTDGGANWSSQTIPASNSSFVIHKAGALFWYWNSGTTAYTSSTGLTGSWTSRTLPITPTNQSYTISFSGAIQIAAAGTTVYESTDAINWAAQVGTYEEYGDKINGIGFIASSSSYTYHSKRANRSTGGGSLYCNNNLVRAMNTAGDVFIFQGGVGKVSRIAPNEADAAIGIFSL